MIYIILAGAVGGLIRGVLGIAKDLVLKKEPTINWFWFIITVLISALLGAVVASFFSGQGIMAFLGGYSGTDFIEGLIKIKLNKLEKEVLPTPLSPKTGTLSGYLKKN
jgi:hypothetical protein